MEKRFIAKPHASIARAHDKPYLKERRGHQRFKLQSTVFLFTRPLVVKTAIIKDISLGGLAYCCASFEQPPAGAFQVDLLAAEIDQYLRLEGLYVQTIDDPVQVRFSAHTAFHASRQEKSFLMMDCRLFFQNLASHQRQGLKFVIRNYTRSAV